EAEGEVAGGAVLTDASTRVSGPEARAGRVEAAWLGEDGLVVRRRREADADERALRHVAAVPLDVLRHDAPLVRDGRAVPERLGDGAVDRLGVAVARGRGELRVGAMRPEDVAQRVVHGRAASRCEEVDVR